MENVEMDICRSTSKHFHYAFDCLHLEFQNKHIKLYKKWIHHEWDVKNKGKQIRWMININRYK
jgi:hypothetical protein